MKNQTPATEKAFKQISFARAFVDEVNVMAEAADRSAAKQIEHCVRIAQAVEQILPSRAIQGLKAGELPAADLLAGLAAVLANPGQSTALRGIMDANPVRVSQAPDEPDASRERIEWRRRRALTPPPAYDKSLSAPWSRTSSDPRAPGRSRAIPPSARRP